MENNQLIKIKNLITICNKAGCLIIGVDKIKNNKQRIFLLLKANDCGANLEKVCLRVQERYNCFQKELENEILNKIMNVENCKLIALCNQKLAEKVVKILEEN